MVRVAVYSWTCTPLPLVEDQEALVTGGDGVPGAFRESSAEGE